MEDTGIPGETTDLPQITDKLLSHKIVQVDVVFSGYPGFLHK
jgi:hypothetical protein